MKYLILFFALLTLSCQSTGEQTSADSGQYLLVLGIAQDAGFPQAGCEKSNCSLVWEGKEEARHATSLGLVDRESGQTWMFEATPDFKEQLHYLQNESGIKTLPSVFLTHAHIGHYTGLMYLGQEVIGASRVPVFVMPRMREYLTTNGPWNQLVNYNNISLVEQRKDSTIHISEKLSVTPLIVPHRDEYSETVGYRIDSPNKKILFIPDINKWDIWERSITEEISKVDLALLDGTFFDQNELPGRDMSKIPHPFIEESIALFEELPESEKAKITFIHFNHTNPLILNSMERKQVENLGFNVAFEGMKIGL
jgi:pyrroloquinoline quinone biosynthesis protein B